MTPALHSESIDSQFEARRRRVLARASRGNLLRIALGVLLFWAFDLWLDPAGARASLLPRLIGGGVLASGVLWIRAVPERWIAETYALLILVAMIVVTVALRQLDGGLLYGCPGVVVFLAVLAYYTVPVRLYLATALAGLAVVLLLALPEPPMVRTNLAIYYALYSWLGVIALSMLRRQQLKVFLLELKHAEDARTDPLTGLYNRRLVYEIGPRQCALARRQDLPLVVMQIDIDRFKAINDRHGHDVGDAVLRAVAGTLRGTLRHGDVLGRVGGEEFAAILFDSTVDDARAVGARLLEAVRRLTFGEAPELMVTISIGLAGPPGPDDDFAVLLRRADHALLQAKAQGRDRLVVDSGEA